MGGVLLNMAVFGAVIAYIMQIAALTLVFLFVNPDYRPSVYGIEIWFAFSLLYFGLYARHRMVLSPEEEFARRTHGAG